MSTKIRPLSLAFSAVLLTVAGHADAQNVANGKRIFTTCAYCHGLGGFGGAVGPSLKGVVGRRAASVDGFPYSDAMRASNLTWTPANLALFLTAPDATVKGTKMIFPGLPLRSDRADVIAYLKQLK